jgi:hypothetical protein
VGSFARAAKSVLSFIAVLQDSCLEPPQHGSIVRKYVQDHISLCMGSSFEWRVNSAEQR